MQTLEDLLESFHLYAVCVTCKRTVQLPIARLIDQVGAEVSAMEIRRRVRCSRCGERTGDIRIIYVGPDRAAAGFHYRR